MRRSVRSSAARAAVLSRMHAPDAGAFQRRAAARLRPVHDARASYAGSDGWTQIFSSPDWAFQRDDAPVDGDHVLAQTAVFACIKLIASDIGKMPLRLLEKNDKIWVETDSPAFSPVLRKPNPWQTRQQFIEHWVTSKLTRGNALILKEFDDRRVVSRLYVLDYDLTRTLVSDSGDVLYELDRDDLSGVRERVVVPSAWVMHDRWNCLHHPLVGLPPIFASGLSAMFGMRIQRYAEQFFRNMSRPGGILTAPGRISDETAARMKREWERNYGAGNVGRVLVTGDNLRFEPLAFKPVDSQIVEQMGVSAQQVCSTYHVPAHMVGVGSAPSYNNIEALQLQYYAQCLQTLIEAIEALLDDGLGLTTPKMGGRQMGVDLGLDGLMRMDTQTQIKAMVEGAGGAVFARNEARERLNLPPVDGGDAILAQQQDFSIAALAERDRNKPFSQPVAPTAAPAADTASKGGDAEILELAARIDKMQVVQHGSHA